MSDSDDDSLLYENPFAPSKQISKEPKKSFDELVKMQRQIDAAKLYEEHSILRNEEKKKKEKESRKEEAQRRKRKASKTKRLEKEELERRIRLLLPEELTAAERKYLRGLDALDAGWGYGYHTGVSIEDMTHDSAHDLQKYSDIVFRIIDKLKHHNSFNEMDVYSKLPQIEAATVFKGPEAKRATELMRMALKKPGFEDELFHLAEMQPVSFQFKIISDAARALLCISNREYERAYAIMLEDLSLRAEHVAVNELKSKQASPKRRKSNSGSGGKLSRKAYFRKIR